MTPMIVEHPLLQHKISILRNKQTGTKEFRDLVGGHADADTGAAEQQGFVALAADHSVTGRQCHVGVIHAGSAVGAKVDILQPQLVQMSLDGFLQFKTAMVGGKRNGFCHEKFQSFPFSVSLFRAAASAARRSARSRSAWLRRW